MGWKGIGRAFCLSVCGVALLLDASPAAGQVSGLSFGEVVRAVKRQIRVAQGREAGRPALTIDRIELDLAVVSSADGDGKLNIWIAEAGGGYGNSQINRMHFDFEPANDILVSANDDAALADAIDSVKKGLRAAASGPAGLVVRGFTMSWEVAVKKSTGGKVAVSIVGGGATLSKSTSHKVTVHMSTPK